MILTFGCFTYNENGSPVYSGTEEYQALFLSPDYDYTNNWVSTKSEDCTEDDLFKAVEYCFLNHKYINYTIKYYGAQNIPVGYYEVNDEERARATEILGSDPYPDPNMGDSDGTWVKIMIPKANCKDFYTFTKRVDEIENLEEILNEIFA